MKLQLDPREVVVDSGHGGVRLHLVQCGPSEGRPILLIPGQSMPWESYSKVMPRLARRFRVSSLDVRGHGRSQHTPGQYSFSRCAEDVIELLPSLGCGPAIVCGNSSGGIIAMIAAARAPELVRGIVMEDPPLFSTDWPRLRDDTWVHGFFEHTVRTLPDLALYFSTLKIPTKGRAKLMSFPRPLAWVLGGAIRRRQKKQPGAPVDIAWLPMHVRLFVRGLSEYDVDFTRACVDGRMCDVNQGDVLPQVKCPIVLMKAHSFRDPELGLVGAMDENDVTRAQTLQPTLQLLRFAKPHIIHLAAPDAYCDAVEALDARAST